MVRKHRHVSGHFFLGTLASLFVPIFARLFEPHLNFISNKASCKHLYPHCSAQIEFLDSDDLQNHSFCT
ncbi:hypothetical protein BDZ45DRAFT_444116 [Acephala macrosclerotiorum]|nr:hypothetical protein BDZ45DRAFT_444116 [Acephala macrosclerotiorum]